MQRTVCVCVCVCVCLFDDGDAYIWSRRSGTLVDVNSNGLLMELELCAITRLLAINMMAQ